MKLKLVTGSVQSKAKQAPTISVCYYNGRIQFNGPTVEMLNLKQGEGLAFYQDEEKPTEWYFMVSNTMGAPRLKEAPNKKALAIVNTGIARAMLRSLGLNESANFFISESKVEGKYWKILSVKS